MASPAHHPKVTISFLRSLIQNMDIQAERTVGRTWTVILKGKGCAARRTFIIRERSSGEVDLEAATAFCYRLRKTRELMKWLEETHNWKEGGYTTAIHPN
jgi:hypothetical protein